MVAKGFDQHGEPVQIVGTGMMARCAQHETDHLDGVLFVDRLDAEARAEALALLAEAEWADAAAYLPSGEPVPPPVLKVSPH